MEYARDNEYKIEGDTRVRTFGGHCAPFVRQFNSFTKTGMNESRGSSNTRNEDSPSTKQNGSKTTTPKKFWKKLTHAEMAARQAEGLCFNCDEMYTP